MSLGPVQPSAPVRPLRWDAVTISIPETLRDATTYSFVGPSEDGFQHLLWITPDEGVAEATVEDYASRRLAAMESLPGFRKLASTGAHLADGTPCRIADVRWAPNDETTLFLLALFVLCDGVGVTLSTEFTRRSRRILRPAFERFMRTCTAGASGDMASVPATYVGPSFAITLPPGWADGSLYVARERTEIGFARNVLLSSSTVENPELGLEEWIAPRLGALASGSDGCTLLFSRSVELDPSVTAWEMAFRRPLSDGTALTQCQLIGRRGTDQRVLTLTCEASICDTEFAKLRAVLHSLRWN